MMKGFSQRELLEEPMKSPPSCSLGERKQDLDFIPLRPGVQ